MKHHEGDLPRAWGGAVGRAELRASPEDFQVDESLGFEPAGCGEHVLLHVRKRDLTTVQVAREVARIAGTRLRDVGYCGMKDRHALTSQWFSVLLTGRPDPDWKLLETPRTTLLGHARHARKLRPGTHRGNRFLLTLRGVEGAREDFEKRLVNLSDGGFPNYFGEQRFGRDGENAARARAMLAGQLRVQRAERGILLSALRSTLFNRVLAARVGQGTWNLPLAEDVLMLAGSRSVFAYDAEDETIASRVASGDVHVTGPLCGQARDALGELRETEQAILAPFAADLAALQAAGMRAARRPLRAVPSDLRWRWLDENCLELRFDLEPGVFATSLARELLASEE